MTTTTTQAVHAPTSSAPPVLVGPPPAPLRRWPALAAAAWVGTFCLVAGGAVVRALAGGGSAGEHGVVLLAIGLRLVTVLMALAAVHRWGRLVPGWLLLAGLWGAAAVQLAYPIAETVVKSLILSGLMDPIDKGISNMSAEGWFNFLAAWLVWGVPGVLFTLAAIDHRQRVATGGGAVAFGVVGGVVLLGGLGLLIG